MIKDTIPNTVFGTKSVLCWREIQLVTRDEKYKNFWRSGAQNASGLKKGTHSALESVRVVGGVNTTC
jgi:hypothetical protein